MCEYLIENTSEDFENVDTPIIYSRKFDEYGLKILDGGTSAINIQYCPWCAMKLPESKRGRWFYEIEKIEIKNPWTDDKIPEKYLSDEWYKEGNKR